MTHRVAVIPSRVLRGAKRGISAAVMIGVEATSAPYVLICGADDVVVGGAVEDLADALDANPAAAAAWGDAYVAGIRDFCRPAVPVLDPWHLTYTNGLPANALYRRTALLDVGGLQIEDGLEDWDLWMALAERGYGGIHLNRVTFRYTTDLGGRTMSEVAPRYNEMYEELRDRHPNLFARRSLTGRASPAPRLLKVAVPLIHRVPLLPPLRKVQLSELLTLLCWIGGIRVTANMLRQAIAVRVRYRFL